MINCISEIKYWNFLNLYLISEIQFVIQPYLINYLQFSLLEIFLNCDFRNKEI